MLALAAAVGLAPAPASAGDAGCGPVPAHFTGRAPSPTLVGHLRDGTLRVLAIGSSSTWGAGSSNPAALSYPAQLQHRLSGRLGAPQVQVVNAGVSGETIEATLARLDKLLAEADFDLVIWQVGTNDAVRGHDLAAFEAQLDRGIAAARADGAEVLLVDPQFFPGIPDGLRYERFVAAIGETAAEHGVALLSRYRLMKAWALQSPAMLEAMLASDKFHMSDRGYGCLADHLAADITLLGGAATAPTAARGADPASRMASAAHTAR